MRTRVDLGMDVNVRVCTLSALACVSRFKHYLFHKVRLHVAVVDMLLETSCFGRSSAVSKLQLPSITLPDGSDAMRADGGDGDAVQRMTSDSRALTLQTQARASGGLGRAARASLRSNTRERARARA